MQLRPKDTLSVEIFTVYTILSDNSIFEIYLTLEQSIQVRSHFIILEKVIKIV